MPITFDNAGYTSTVNFTNEYRKDGTVTGVIVKDDGRTVTVRMSGGHLYKVPKSQITSITGNEGAGQ